MRTELLSQFTLLVTILLVTSGEGFFFNYHKKLLSNILNSLKDKVESKKKPYEIQHYHWHYYPLVHPLSGSFTKAPKKHELDNLHHDTLSSLGWAKYEYKYIPETKIKIPSTLSHSWDTIILDPTDHKIVEADLAETVDHSEHEGILIEVPDNKKIIIENEHPKDLKELKYGLLASLFHKSSSSGNHI
ncbi:uncharacterized protein LOC143358908 [Halictus rubicundus]|uniref:uncharacterized protein LOC143358908 n=1 Tax=Halictus rubicundus TaxID=77578 RepID=UPI0040375128